MNIIRWLGIIVFILINITNAQAMNAGFYVGVEAGKSNNNNTTQSVNIQRNNSVNGVITSSFINGVQVFPLPPGASPPPVPPLFVAPSNTGFAGRFFAGYYYNRYVAFEGGYVHYAPSVIKPYPNIYASGPMCGSQSATTVTPCINPTIRENGVDLEIKGILPFYNVGIFGKLGIAAIQVSYGGSLVPFNGASSSNLSKVYIRPLIGIGVEYDIYQRFQVSISYTEVLKGGGGFQQADFLSAGFSYHFVDLICGQFLC